MYQRGPGRRRCPPDASAGRAVAASPPPGPCGASVRPTGTVVWASSQLCSMPLSGFGRREGGMQVFFFAFFFDFDEAQDPDLILLPGCEPGDRRAARTEFRFEFPPDPFFGDFAFFFGFRLEPVGGLEFFGLE